MLSGIAVIMTRILMILPPSMIPLKKTMKSDTLISTGSISIVLFLPIIPVVKWSSMMHVSSLFMKTKWITYLTLSIWQLSVIFMEYIHLKCRWSLQISIYFAPFLVAPLQIPSNARLVLQQSTQEDEFSTPLNRSQLTLFSAIPCG
jgi:hypothetical protein